MAPKIEIGRLFWFNLLRELDRRGAGNRESGAFLLARDQSSTVVDAVYYDDLDPGCCEYGYIRFDGAGYVPLWRICEAKHLRVVADVHTHPTAWTGQSGADSANPMVAQKGHVALIIPNFSGRLRFSLQGVGIYEYLGEGDWRQWEAASGFVSLKIL